MTLQSQITEDMKTAMKAKDAAKLSTLRMLATALTNEAVAQKRPDRTLDDAAVQGVIRKLVKQRLEAAEEYTKAGSADRAASERSEADMLKAYLPAAMDQAELAAIVDQAISESGATSAKDFGKAMKVAVEKVAGRAESGQIAGLLKVKLPKG